jgi:multiple sugar transport system permease protein
VLIAVYLTFAIPLSAWLLFTYLSSLPADIEDAASVDGCSPAKVLRYVVIPLLKPGLMVSFLFSMLLSWSDVLFASVLTTNTTRTVAVGLQAFLSGESGNAFWGSLMAASLLNALLIAVLFLVCQRFLVRGLTAGAVTG